MNQYIKIMINTAKQLNAFIAQTGVNTPSQIIAKLADEKVVVSAVIAKLITKHSLNLNH